MTGNSTNGGAKQEWLAKAVSALDFDRDIRDFVLTNLPYEPAARSELEAETTSGLLITYFNWHCRLVPTKRRRVHKSSELKRKMRDLPTAQRRAIQKIEEDISRGRDVRPYLSRRIQCGYTPRKSRPKQAKRRWDRDLMLYDWGLHHLHLSDELDEDGFAGRTDDLLFAGFLGSDAYLVDVAPHGSWYLRRLLETIVVNWPDSGLLLPSLSGLRLTTTFSEEEGESLRKAGVAASFFEFEDQLWAPRDFISSAATSLRATQRANFILHEAGRLADLLSSDPLPIVREFEDAVGPIPRPRFRLFIEAHRYGILEESSDAFLVVGKLRE